MNSVKAALGAIVLAFLLTGASVAQPDAEFEVTQVRPYCNDTGRAWVSGAVKNVGDSAAGVELEATMYDDQGQVLHSVSWYPASTSNIAPGEVEPYDYPFGEDCPSGEWKASVSVESTVVW